MYTKIGQFTPCEAVCTFLGPILRCGCGGPSCGRSTCDQMRSDVVISHTGYANAMKLLEK